MGLDAVEIVMEIEDAFDVRLEDAEVEKISTPRDVIELVMSKVARADAAGCLTQRAFNRLRATLLRHLPLKRRDVAPRSGMNDLVPRRERQKLLDQLAAELGTPPLPRLVRPKWLVALLVVCSIVAGIGLAVFVFRQGLLKHSGALLFAGLVAGAGTGFLAGLLTLSCRTEFPRRIGTVGDLSRWGVAHQSVSSPATPRKWTREQVAARVRDITIEQLECEATYREDASFVQDLGTS